jgi:anti-anti-sigma factor
MLKVIVEKDRYLVSLLQVRKLNTLFSELISQQLNGLVSVTDRHVIFDLSGVNHIDNAGFNTLLKATEIASAVRSTFELCNISKEVMESIKQLNLSSSLMIAESHDMQENMVFEIEN